MRTAELQLQLVAVQAQSNTQAATIAEQAAAAKTAAAAKQKAVDAAVQRDAAVRSLQERLVLEQGKVQRMELTTVQVRCFAAA
jgi:hypothetical protein